ncbi:nuclear transport factor 2 family protein [Paraburkholderia sediminicola]|uniref:nuclear transport factor 2 family protein n=1 Tax=Paraburkholderia sediminicola TaxID=458836 RepID=UPI0014150576
MLDATAHLEIIDLYSEYNRAIDKGDADNWANTFTDDGLFHHPARVFSGADELRQFIRERTAKLTSSPSVEQQHWNSRVCLEGRDGWAHGSCQLIVTGVNRETGKPCVVVRGNYEDQLERSEAGWRFKKRRLVVL